MFLYNVRICVCTVNNEGKCKVIVSNDDGKEVEIAQLNDCDYCGEQALLNDARMSASTTRMAHRRTSRTIYYSRIWTAKCTRKSAQKKALLISQDEEGNTFYVIETGEFQITVEDVGTLYNAPRAASVQCVSDTNEGGIVWCVVRGQGRFQESIDGRAL